MSLIPGKYQHHKNENMDEYLTAIGMPYLGRQMASMSSPVMEITLDGDKMTIVNKTMLLSSECTFKIGEDYEEKPPKQVLKSKTTLINDHEMETVSIDQNDGHRSTRRYFFTEDECIITVGSDKTDIAAKRIFRRVK